MELRYWSKRQTVTWFMKLGTKQNKIQNQNLKHCEVSHQLNLVSTFQRTRTSTMNAAVFPGLYQWQE